MRKGALAALTALAVCASVAGVTGCSNGGVPRPDGELPLGLGGTPSAKAPDTGDGGTDTADLPDGGSGPTAPADRSAAEIAEAMSEAMDGLRSLRITGSLTDGGERMGVDMVLTDDGRCSGSMTVNGGTVEIVGTDERMYLKGDERFWKGLDGGAPGGQGAVEILEGRWIDAGDRGSDGDFEGFCDLAGFLEATGVSDTSRVTKGEPTRINGRETVPLIERNGRETTTGYVANDPDEPYLLRMENEGGDEPGVMDFTDHDEEVEIEGPDPSEVLDPGDMGNRGPTENV
ncbi:hypothetical protein F0L17_17585 [Streptomyces sp. TRM43335]|uniref:Lipoprotein n=1 Tax=Streptomyces taklimakanensis TaxID=2569853 RepID=A0A6G2BF33_9ACTN|nr:hypothetical protein [Streptomyces taklimakanensis]MTE20895.1 hypothetical protein [Streptomyces taklimakanensis]